MDETKGGRRPMLGDKSTLTSAPFNSCAWDNAPFSKTDSGFLPFLPALSDVRFEHRRELRILLSIIDRLFIQTNADYRDRFSITVAMNKLLTLLDFILSILVLALVLGIFLNLLKLTSILVLALILAIFLNLNLLHSTLHSTLHSNLFRSWYLLSWNISQSTQTYFDLGTCSLGIFLNLLKLISILVLALLEYFSIYSNLLRS